MARFNQCGICLTSYKNRVASGNVLDLQTDQTGQVVGLISGQTVTLVVRQDLQDSSLLAPADEVLLLSCLPTEPGQKTKAKRRKMRKIEGGLTISNLFVLKIFGNIIGVTYLDFSVSQRLCL